MRGQHGQPLIEYIDRVLNANLLFRQVPNWITLSALIDALDELTAALERQGDRTDEESG